MDTRSEVRDFLVSRRSWVTPEQAGIPAGGGNRRRGHDHTTTTQKGST